MVMIPRSSVKTSADQSLPDGALVMYEHDNSPILAAVRGSRKNKFQLLNERGREVELAANRIHRLPGNLPASLSSEKEITGYLESLHNSGTKEGESFDLEELWTVVQEESREYSQKELVELVTGEDSLASHLALRLALLSDPLFFKRKRDAFVPRSPASVEELKKAQEAKQRKQALADKMIELVQQRLAGDSGEIPVEVAPLVALLEDLATRSTSVDAARSKEAHQLLDKLNEESDLSLRGPRDLQAFYILQKIRHFDKRTNIPLLRHRIPVEFSEEELQAAEQLQIPATPLEFADHEVRRDLTNLRTITIDDSSTLDMDDAISLEQTPDGYRLGIHITDVASSIVPGSVLDQTAIQRGTSLYLADTTVNMLPSELSHRTLSLIEGEVRPCISILCNVTSQCEIHSTEIVPSIIRVNKNYSYDEVDELLLSDHSLFSTLYNIALERESDRFAGGGFKIHKRDIQVVVHENGSLSLIEIDEHSPARSLVGEMMILANELTAQFARDNNIPIFYRSQEKRDEQDPSAFKNIPDGPALDYAIRSGLRPSSMSLNPAPHATLGLDHYTQATSPIRRYLDLLHQRQLLGFLIRGKPLYTGDEMQELLSLTEPALQRANVVSRESRRFWFLKYLEQRARDNKEIIGVVLRTDLKIPLIELDELFFSVLARVPSESKPGDTFRFKIQKVQPAMDELRLDVIEKL